ncbi:CBS domain-containing protein [Anianabacter salinae]|uniref:CBS domain-containing protein n=1 Tax=Anianabacter salinae TaxID=2851023 RepID=UPI00225DD06A|nr:CBS domain-containing protein [Anianabacter salinae]MBV0914169.1 CBS domain-containing protein [Anianabacter salinae]
MSTPQAELTTVSEVALALDSFPVVEPRTYLKVALERMEQFRLGVVCICDAEDTLLGVLTDGDLRRKVLHIQKPFSALFSDDVIIHSVQSATTVAPDSLLTDAVKLMGEKRIWDLPVTTSEGKLVGLLHLHPAIEAVLNQ